MCDVGICHGQLLLFSRCLIKQLRKFCDFCSLVNGKRLKLVKMFRQHSNCGGAAKVSMIRATAARWEEIQLSCIDICRFTREFSDNNSVTEVEIRMDKLDELWKVYSETVVNIFAPDD